MLTEEAVCSLVHALCSAAPRDAAEEPETLEVLHVQKSGSVLPALKLAGVQSKRSPKLTQQAALACLAAPQIYVRRHASDVQVGKQPSQRK